MISGWAAVGAWTNAASRSCASSPSWSVCRRSCVTCRLSATPFLGGTYFPPEPRHGLPSFRQVLVAVSDTYRERRGDVSRQAQALVDAIAESARLSHRPTR